MWNLFDDNIAKFWQLFLSEIFNYTNNLDLSLLTIILQNNDQSTLSELSECIVKDLQTGHILIVCDHCRIDSIRGFVRRWLH